MKTLFWNFAVGTGCILCLISCKKIVCGYPPKTFRILQISPKTAKIRYFSNSYKTVTAVTFKNITWHCHIGLFTEKRAVYRSALSCFTDLTITAAMTSTSGNTQPASIPFCISSPAFCEMLPTTAGPSAPPISPATAGSANIAVPPDGILAEHNSNGKSTHYTADKSYQRYLRQRCDNIADKTKSARTYHKFHKVKPTFVKRVFSAVQAYPLAAVKKGLPFSPKREV